MQDHTFNYCRDRLYETHVWDFHIRDVGSRELEELAKPHSNEELNAQAKQLLFGDAFLVNRKRIGRKSLQPCHLSVTAWNGWNLSNRPFPC